MNIDIKKLPEVNLRAKCLKCGYADIEAEYMNFDMIIKATNNRRFIFINHVGDQKTKEVMLRRCMKCRYEWLERCKEMEK